MGHLAETAGNGERQGGPKGQFHSACSLLLCFHRSAYRRRPKPCCREIRGSKTKASGGIR
ncbi:hypothetical protein PGR6_41430 [Pseudomonas sp. GR 6-02]|nr:hypothetical protein PGR6_41430 [Pseudomonas sp. GR 6-02]